MPKTPDEIFAEKIKYLLAEEKKLDKAVKALEKALFEIITSEYLPKFKLKNGFVTDTSYNIGLINQIDSLFARIQKAVETDILKPFATTLLESANMSVEYYVGLGFRKTVVLELLKNKVALEKRIGIQPNGQLKRNGYLYRLGQSNEVRQKLQNYVMNSITGDVDFIDFQKGFRDLVIGNKRLKALNVDGALVKYYDQYAYDTYNAMDSVVNKQLATGLNLKHFIYQGSLIETSRGFCKKRAGKAFTIEETKTWKDDPDLIDKKTKNAYNPLIDRGRYRCRHFIKYITEETYNKRKNA